VERPIRTVALCAGSGSSVFKSLAEEVDVLFTGELSHHEVLAAVAKGQYVILCGHSNTERCFLPTLQSRLQQNLDDKIGKNGIKVIISKKDRDPLEII
jgi:putative NIF3 family GTP cyclohydrolase 1 type 2